MRLEEVKRGLWGYQRDAVFRYIAGQEEAFGQKLAEKDAQMMRAGQQAQARIRDLEEENRALKEEMRQLRGQQDQIARAILDARASAEALWAETVAQEAAARAEMRRALEEDRAALEKYRQKVSALREMLRSTVAGLEEKAEEMERQADELYAASPAERLTLFQ